MAGGNNSSNMDQIAAELARAAAEAARQARILVLNQQITRKNQELTIVSQQIASLSSEQGNLENYLSDWNTQKAAYSANETVSEVVIVNVFEGRCADAIKEELTACVEEMDKTYSSVTTLQGNVGMQINKLQLRVNTINEELRNLRLELSCL